MSGLFAWPATAFDKVFEKATSHLLLEPDWESILQICDSIRQNDVQPKYAVSCMKKKLYSSNPHVVLYTLQVLESCMKNCGSPIHTEVASRPFMEELREVVKTTTNDNVRNRILELIQTWAHVFRNEPKYRAVQDIFNMLKVEGYKFQALKESDAMFVADIAPDWADGTCCHRCRTQFSVVIRKHHCRNCGQVFCSKCSSRNCPIPRFGLEKEVRVCEACWEKLNKPANAPKSSSPNPELSPQSNSQEPASGNRKSEQELKEEEDLQLALALSQSEAESKEKHHTPSKPVTTSYSIPEDPPEKKSSPVDSELDRYLNRSYWEKRQQQQEEVETRTSPVPSAPLTTYARINEKYQNGDVDELTDFLGNLRTTVDIFVNRMKSNSSRGRPIANDTHVQSLFMNITNMHSQLLKYVQEQDDMRAYYERLQDKLNQARDARAALDALREEHREKLRREAEEAERQRQIQMAHKLEIMRKKKQEYLQYQRELAIQRIQEQEREMQMRQEQQKQQYQAFAPTTTHNYMTNGNPYYGMPSVPPGAPFPQQAAPVNPQMMMHMGMMPQAPPIMQQQSTNQENMSPQHQAPPPPEAPCDPLIVFD